MDNEQVREWLARNAQEEKGTFNRATIERLLAESDELARLRAEIAGLVEEMKPLGKSSSDEWAKGFSMCAVATVPRLRALLRLPAGESQDATTRAQGEG